MRSFAVWFSLALVFVIPLENALFVEGMGRLSKVVGLALGGAWLLALLWVRGVRRPRAIHLAMLVFVCWSILSFLWSVDPDDSKTRALTYLQIFGMVVIFWDLWDTPRSFRRALQAYVLGCWIPMFAAMKNYFTVGETFYSKRYSASGFHVNDLGLIVALAIPISWFLALGPRIDRTSRFWSLANWLFTPFAVFTVFLTASRSSIVGLLPSLVFAFALVNRLRPGSRMRILIASLAAVIAIVPLIPQTSFERFLRTKETVTEGDFNGRLDIWRQGIEIFSEHPWAGVGTGAFRTANVDIGKMGHNIAISLLAEVGLIGFLVFCVVLFLTVRHAFAQRSELRNLWLTLLSIWGLAAMTHNWEARKQTWLLFSLIVIAASLRESAEEPGLEAAPARIVGSTLDEGLRP